MLAEQPVKSGLRSYGGLPAKRFARLVSLTQSAKNCKRNVQKYFHDILNRVVVTVKDELACILPHKWVEPVTIPLVY